MERSVASDGPAFASLVPHSDSHESEGLTDEIKVTITAQACLLLLHRDTDDYPRLVTIL
jgi:hypothetical protein